ncbi:hypothetical protein HGB24_02885 [Candidatus Saccharibacteria bacterium]|nr:hypothetical protein [Candidatus Saccharibacteria bacterium]
MKNDVIVKPGSKPVSVNKPDSHTIHSVSHKPTSLRHEIASGHAPSVRPMIKRVSMDIAKSNHIARFSKSVTNTTTKAVHAIQAPIRHPLAQKADMRATQKHNPSPATKTPKEIKEAAIAEAFAKLELSKQKDSDALKHSKRVINIVAASIALLFLAVLMYFIYLNVPSVSMSVVGAQAGISATFPNYYPDGYGLNGPASLSNGSVIINFKSNSNNTNFLIKQVKSSWDSTAVKSMVSKNSADKFITTTERGLTIFSYDGNAAWVNGGILYTITGNAPLTTDQIRRIATSL